MKTLSVTLFALAYSIIAVSQNTLTGIITATNSSEALPGTVFIPQLEIGINATLGGVYTINGISNGSYTVIYSYLGYATISKRIVFSESKTITTNVQMVESAIEMEEVIIATPFHKLQRDNVLKIERITIGELGTLGATTLAEGITSIAGVESISTGIGIGKPVIRGLSANRVLVYTQGIRLENQQFGDEHGLGVNQAGIESVEIIKGPASLLYGSDALGGVLYINPERFANIGDTKADLNVNYFSNTLGYNIDAGAKTSGEKFKFITRIAYATHSDYKTGSNTRVTNTRFNETDFKTGLRYQSPKLKSTLRYNYNRSNIGIPKEIAAQSTDKKPVVPFQEIDSHIVSLQNNIFLNNSSFDVKVGYIFNDRREFEDEFGNDAALQLKLSTINYDVKYNLPDYGKFETIVGVQGMFQENKNFGVEILIPDARVTDIGVLGTTHYHLEKIHLQGGFRYDIRNLKSDVVGVASDFAFIPAISRNFGSFNGALGAKVDLSEKMNVRINIASGFRAPNLAELSSNGVHEGTNRYEIGNSNLENEQNLQFDLSLEYNNKHIEVFANGFYNLINNYIFVIPTGDIIEDTFVFNYIQDNSYLFGGEIGLHLHPYPLDWMHLESSFQTVTGKLSSGEFLPLIPANSIRNTLNVELKDGKVFRDSGMFITQLNVFNQNNVSNFETRTGGYSIFNFGGNSSFKTNTFKIDFGIVVTNVFNKVYASHLSRLKADGILNIGRNINVRISVVI